MRIITILGIVLVVIGAVTLAASSGAFDSAVADRSTAVETADDESALLGLEYSNEDGIELERADSDTGEWCIIFGICDGFRYNDVEIVLLKDNTSSQQLTVEEMDIETDNTAIVRDGQLRSETRSDGNEIGVALGNFECPAERDELFSRQQTGDFGTITVSIEASDGDITIDLDREVTVECISE